MASTTLSHIRTVMRPSGLIPFDLMALGAIVLAATFVSTATAALTAATLLFGLLILGKIERLMVLLFAVFPFQQSLLGDDASGNVSAVDCLGALLFLGLLVHIVRTGGLRLGPAGGPLVIFLGIAVLSTIFHQRVEGTMLSLGRMILATFISMAIFANLTPSLTTIHRCFNAYLIGIVVLFGFGVAAFATGGYTASQYTLGMNKNFLGSMYGCGILVASSYLMGQEVNARHRIWLGMALAAATGGILLSLSRGAWVATSVGIVVILIGSRRLGGMLIFSIIGFFAAILMWALLPEEATDYATNLSTDTYQVSSRIDAMNTTMEAFFADPMFGGGIGLRKKLEPHNLIVLTLGESGIVGIVGFLLAFGAGAWTLFHAMARARGPGARLIVILGTSIFVQSFVHGLFDVYWRRGVAFMAWACVGWAVAIMKMPVPKISRPSPKENEMNSATGAPSRVVTSVAS